MVFCTNCQADVDLEYADAGALSCCPQCGRVFDDVGFSNDLTFARGADGEGEMVGQFVSETGQVSANEAPRPRPSYPSDVKLAPGDHCADAASLQAFSAVCTQTGKAVSCHNPHQTDSCNPARHSTIPCNGMLGSHAPWPPACTCCPRCCYAHPPPQPLRPQSPAACLCITPLRCADYLAWAMATGSGAPGPTASRWP
jgi:hypothetical protein